ncbi:MAG: hypothetical protein L3J16_04300, partial [Anaerolineales bacterium]|nr:hypothetical protein [Anaerolineales bacterium]
GNRKTRREGLSEEHRRLNKQFADQRNRVARIRIRAKPGSLPKTPQKNINFTLPFGHSIG